VSCVYVQGLPDLISQLNTKGQALTHFFPVDTHQDGTDSGALLFDRVDASIFAAAQYFGFESVLPSWAPLLNSTRNGHSCLLTSLVTWHREDRCPPPLMQQQRLSKMISIINEEKGRGFLQERINKTAAASQQQQQQQGVGGAMLSPTNTYILGATADACPVEHTIDWSSEFEQYLARHGADDAGRKASLKRRSANKLVPFRIGAAVGASMRAVPWRGRSSDAFISGLITKRSGYEAFVEWTRATPEELSSSATAKHNKKRSK